MQNNTNDPQQAAVIAFKRDAKQLRFCVTHKPRNGAWGTPKGFVDLGDTLPETALKEAHEEAGLHGRLIDDFIGTYDYAKWGSTYTVAVYIMEVVSEDDHWEEEDFRERHWLKPEAVKKRLRKHPIYPLFKRAMKLLDE